MLPPAAAHAGLSGPIRPATAQQNLHLLSLLRAMPGPGHGVKLFGWSPCVMSVGSSIPAYTSL
jgi:hypothetical protein